MKKFLVCVSILLVCSVGFSAGVPLEVDKDQLLSARLEALRLLADEFAATGEKVSFEVTVEKMHALQDQWNQSTQPVPSPENVQKNLDQERIVLRQDSQVPNDNRNHVIYFKYKGQTHNTPPLPLGMVDAQVEKMFADHEVNGSHMNPHEIALTFDDGPHATLSRAIEAVLAANQVPAAFFEIGENVARLPRVTRYLSNRGYVIGNHSWNHPQLTKLDTPVVRKQLDDAQAAIQEAIGGADSFDAYFQFLFARYFSYPRKIWAPEFMRSPYGARSSRTLHEIYSTQAGDASLVTGAQPVDLTHVMWNIDSLDWNDPSPAGIENRVFSQLALENHHGIILFHDIHPQTLAAIQSIIPRLRREGYKLVNLYDMMTEKK